MKRDVISDLNEKIKAKAAMHANDPENDPPSGQLDYELSLVAKLFDGRPLCCDKCIYHCELSDTCQVLDEGDASMCPEFTRLVDDAMHAMQDEHEAGYP